MHFKEGDAVMHPARGAGRILRIEERSWEGVQTQYYVIEMLDQPRSTVRIPIGRADGLGLRRTMPASELGTIWEVMQSDCEELPTEHKERSNLLNARFAGGDALRIAAIVRDLTGYQHEHGRLNTAGEPMFRKALKFLAMEVAATKGIDLDHAELQVRAHLQEKAPSPDAA